VSLTREKLRWGAMPGALKKGLKLIWPPEAEEPQTDDNGAPRRSGMRARLTFGELALVYTSLEAVETLRGCHHSTSF
jgi:hypothetical protein